MCIKFVIFFYTFCILSNNYLYMKNTFLLILLNKFHFFHFKINIMSINYNYILVNREIKNV